MSDNQLNAEGKTKNQLKNEAKKAAKLAKFKEKEEKLKARGDTFKQKAPKEIKVKKEYKAEVDNNGRKVTSNEMPESYDPVYVESYWYDWWIKNGVFKPEIHKSLDFAKKDEKFVMVIPPPNVTGSLHLGHALTNSIEDALTRWNRMLGKETVWLPGCDHAGIATQVVVEKKLMRERQLTRYDLGRDAFIKEVWKWKDEKGHRIYDQLKSLGISCDWDRARFTMDPQMSDAVVESFVRLHERGLIYRNVRLVNWSCTLKSAISDIEVDKKELTGRTLINVPGYKKPVEFGVITSFAYPIVGGKEGEELVVATTRLETMLGDTGVAVHPDDERYKHLHGKLVKHPLVPGRTIPIVADSFVEKDFGTGAVKLTPAHDHNDWEAGKRHNLPSITVIDEAGNMNDQAGEAFAGMKRFDARIAVREALDKLGLLRGDEDNPMVVPICSRTKDIIEPLLKPQWYLKCQHMADRAMQAVADGDLRIVPDMHVRTWNGWLKDCHDWCISRQLWWGHQIPVYLIHQRPSPQADWVPRDSLRDDAWVSARDAKEALQKAMKITKCSDEKLIKVEQDEDVLDTWFSSQLFPFAAFGWPNDTCDLKRFYPGSLLETGHDIIFFWVARMVMIGLELTGKLPFHTVYLHAMVRDAHGLKMSKSLGNAIDPVDVINGITLPELHHQLQIGNLDPKELKRATASQTQNFPNGIPQCGTDALRFSLCAYTAQGRNINLDILRVQGYRFFCNKLWNASRFVLCHSLSADYVPPASESSLMPGAKGSVYGQLAGTDRWILRRLAACIAKCEEAFQTYNFPDATTACYNFWLYEFCDIYLEYSKPKIWTLRDKNEKVAEGEAVCHVLYTCMQLALRLIHPLMPFISEELYQRLPLRKGLSKDSAPVSICITEYPQPKTYSTWFDEATSEANEKAFQFAYDVVKQIRSTRAAYRLDSNKLRPRIQLLFSDEATLGAIHTGGYIPDCIEVLAKCEVAQATTDKTAVEASGCLHFTIFGEASVHCVVYMDVAAYLNVQEELDKVQLKLRSLKESSEKLKEAMSKPEYTAKVPQSKQDTDKSKLLEMDTETSNLQEMMSQLCLMDAVGSATGSGSGEGKSSTGTTTDAFTEKVFEYIQRLGINATGKTVDDFVRAMCKNKQNLSDVARTMQWFNWGHTGYFIGLSNQMLADPWLADQVAKNEIPALIVISLAKLNKNKSLDKDYQHMVEIISKNHRMLK